jgi:hypothetical protein
MAGTSAPSPHGPTVWPLHPFFFAAGSVLSVYATKENLGQMDVGDMLPVLATALAGTAIVFLVLAALMRDVGPRAAIPTGVIVVGCVHFSAFAVRLERLDSALGGILPTEGALPLMLVLVLLLLAVGGAVSASRFHPTLINGPLNAFALVLFITPVWNAAWYHWETAGARLAPPAPTGDTGDSGSLLPNDRPDIYFFIFDRYGSQRVLKREYGFDNTPFLEFLEEQGFYVAPESHSNYSKTAPSLASTFHMDYLDFLADEPLAQRNEWHPIYDMVKGEHRVGRFLKKRGYHFIQIGSWWALTQDSTLADESYSFGLSEFGLICLRKTMLPRLLQAALPQSGLARMMAWDHGQCRRVPLQARMVKEIARRPEVTFTFVHVLVPHAPFVFDAAGNCRTPDEIDRIGPRDSYVDQIAYANRLMRELVASLLGGDGPKPIIVLQSDEGPFPERYERGNRSWRQASAEELDTKSGILNAYYFPDEDYSRLYSDITPVNSFRLLFDKYFGAEYRLLPDRILHFPDLSHLYDFFDVTERVRNAVNHTDSQTVGSRLHPPAATSK